MIKNRRCKKCLRPIDFEDSNGFCPECYKEMIFLKKIIKDFYGDIKDEN